MPDLLKQVKDTIRKHEMLSGGEAVVAAVSGGADSVVMLHALWSLRDELKLKIIVAHLDHGLRGAESRRDYLFVKGLARSMGLPFEGRRLKKGTLKAIGGSVQEAARNIRYEFLDEVARKFKAGRIILGHTLDDQAETVLMRLIKGASLSGLTGIPPKREKYIRPLIETKRDDIEGYAGEAGLKFVVDSSNLEAKYLRNRIRLGLIPALKKEYNPKITETIARTAALLADDRLVDLPGGEIVGPVEVDIEEALVVAEVEVRLRAVLGHEHLAVLVGVHGPGVHVDVGVAFEAGDLEPPALQELSQRRRRDPLPE